MPTGMCEMSNQNLILLAEAGNHEACYERLIRDIMRVDQLEYMDAKKIADGMRENNRAEVAKYNAASRLGLAGSTFCLAASIPMVFSKSFALWFNEKYVTSEVPPPEDLETFWEVGSWTWNWMEPVMGTGSFMLLCMQLMRAQMINMSMSPYTDWIKKKRAERLISLFPKYTEDIVYDFAFTASLKTNKRH